MRFVCVPTRRHLWFRNYVTIVFVRHESLINEVFKLHGIEKVVARSNATIEKIGQMKPPYSPLQHFSFHSSTLFLSPSPIAIPPSLLNQSSLFLPLVNPRPFSHPVHSRNPEVGHWTCLTFHIHVNDLQRIFTQTSRRWYPGSDVLTV